MLNYTFDGYVRDELGAVVPGAYVQAWFDRNNGASSPSDWNVAQQADANGYYSFNLGDGDFLTQDGSAAAGDKVVLAVWLGNPSRTSPQVTHMAYLPVTLTAAAVYTQDLVLLADRAPTTGASVPSATPRLAPVVLTNTSTDTATGSGMTQARLYEAELVFDAVGVDHVHVDWGDGVEEDLTGNGSHSYSVPGGSTVTVTARAYDERGNAGNLVTINVNVKWRTPTGGFSWLPASPTVEDLVTFTPSITDPDVQVTSVDWWVDGVEVETGLAPDATWQHQFATNGPHTVRQVVHWHDGFAAQSFSYDRTVTVVNILPTAAWEVSSQGTAATRYTWVSTAEDPDGTVVLYAWLLERWAGSTWAFEASASGAGMDAFAYSFASEGLYRLTHTVTDDDGGQGSHQEQFNVTIDAAPGRVLIIPLASD